MGVLITTTVYIDADLKNRAAFGKGEFSKFVNSKLKEFVEEKEKIGRSDNNNE